MVTTTSIMATGVYGKTTFETSELQNQSRDARIPTPASSDDGLPHQIYLPETQNVVMTPVMGSKLNMQNLKAEVREPEVGQVVIRVAWTGICRSDICFSIGPEPDYPATNHIAGHEAIGHVVRSHDPLLLGCPVATRYLASTCQTCYYCLKGLPESCSAQRNFPKHYAGSYQQYMTVPWTSAMRLPSWVFAEPPNIHPASYTAALCSGSTALKAVQTANLSPGDVVVIVGVTGAIGHLAGMIARNVFKARVIGVDYAWKCESLSTQSREAFDQFLPFPTSSNNEWATYFERLAEHCKEQRDRHCEPRLADSLIVTASSGSAFLKMEEYVCDGGNIICVGTPRGDVQITIPLCTLVERQLTMKGVMMGGDREAYQMLDYIRSGLIKPCISEITLSDVPVRIDDFLRFTSAGKTVVRVNGTLSLEETEMLASAARS